MNATECSGWTRGRLLIVAGAFAVLQTGLILLFGDRSLPPPPARPPAVRFWTLGEPVSDDVLLRQFFAGDPAVFPLPNPRGFSGRAWMDAPRPQFQTEIALEPPAWLNLDAARLGTNFPPAQTGPQSTIADLAQEQPPRVEPLPVFLKPEIVPAQSAFLLEGELAGHLLGQPPALRSWPSPQLLGNSVVQIAVDPAGEVIAARLEARCGLAEDTNAAPADANAVAMARTLRFEPSSRTATRWGRAVFQWQTTEPGNATK
jgi:hypothetical protein